MRLHLSERLGIKLMQQKLQGNPFHGHNMIIEEGKMLLDTVENNHQAVNGFQFGVAAHGDGLGAGGGQRGQVLAGVALQGEHPDARRAHCAAGPV